MDNLTQQRLLDFLQSTFNPDGSIHLLAVSAKDLPQTTLPPHTPHFQVRVALTFQEGDTLCPYFDGTDVFVTIQPAIIQFIHEESWADGPPIMEGSPNELALAWVTKLATPIYISLEAKEAARQGTLNERNLNLDRDGKPWF